MTPSFYHWVCVLSMPSQDQDKRKGPALPACVRVCQSCLKIQTLLPSGTDLMPAWCCHWYTCRGWGGDGGCWWWWGDSWGWSWWWWSCGKWVWRGGAGQVSSLVAAGLLGWPAAADPVSLSHPAVLPIVTLATLHL